jgi:hypothetical protein
MRYQRRSTDRSSTFNAADNRQQRKSSKLDMQVSQSIKRSQVVGDRLVSCATPQVITITSTASGAGAAVLSVFLSVAGCRTAIDSATADTETS